MIARFYQNIILKSPKVNFFTFNNSFTELWVFSKDFRLDASSETLLIEVILT